MLLDEMEIFYYVVELNSFSKAAKRLGVSNSLISKRISKLERTMAVNLLTRSTRKLSLTEAGKAFYQHCANVVKQAEQGYDMLAELQGAVSGTLKIAAPPALAIHKLGAVIDAFITHHPDVRLELHLDSRLVDTIAGAFDLVLRSAQLESSNLIAQKLMDIQNIICATPDYWQQHPLPQRPDELANHCWAVYGHSNQIKTLTLHHKSQENHVTINSRVCCSSLEAIKAMVMQNTCVAALPAFMVDDLLQSGQLLSCLPPYRLTPSPLYALYPKRDFMPPKVTVFLSYLKQHL